MTKSILDLRVAVAKARAATQPNTRDLAIALAVGADLLARWERVAIDCGRVWTAAQARRMTRDIRTAMQEVRRA